MAIVLSIPESLPERQLLLDMTLGVVLFTLLVNAPTIRPLMSRLGLDRMTADEEAELKHALEDAERKADHTLEEFATAGVLGDADRGALRARLGEVMVSSAGVDLPDQARREAFLVAVRAEMEALDELYEIGVVTQYTYLDLRDLLQRDRERNATGEVQVQSTREGQNLFMRLERAMLRRLRERNWAAGLLSRYQQLRMTQHLQHNIAGILMARAGIAALEARGGLEASERDALKAIYQGRLARRQARLAVIRRDFEAFYDSFVRHLATRVGLTAGLLGARHQVHAGEIGAKAFASIDRQLRAALEDVPPIEAPQAQLAASALIEMVPLFSAVSEQALEELAARAQTVTFLPGDEIIGEGERGNALYILTQGEVRVEHGRGDEARHLADLGAGDFFGEAALLGDDVRTATVRAVTPSTLLRLTRRDVLDLAHDFPEVERSLEDVRSARTAAD